MSDTACEVCGHGWSEGSHFNCTRVDPMPDDRPVSPRETVERPSWSLGWNEKGHEWVRTPSPAGTEREERDHWIRLFNRLEAAVSRHITAKSTGFSDDADEALAAAHRAVLSAAARPSSPTPEGTRPWKLVRIEDEDPPLPQQPEMTYESEDFG